MANTPCITKKAVPETGSMAVKYSFIERPRSWSTRLNSAASSIANATHPIPSRRDNIDGTAKRRTTHRAAIMTTPNMMGISISSAILSPKRGTTHSMRIGPSTKPAPNTSEKYNAPAFTTCLMSCPPVRPSLNVTTIRHSFPCSKHCIC